VLDRLADIPLALLLNLWVCEVVGGPRSFPDAMTAAMRWLVVSYILTGTIEVAIGIASS
jgi:hypothetical protein